VKPAPFDYRLAASVEEALALLAGDGADVRPLAGGQTLVPLLSLRIVQPDCLVDISRIGSLREAREEEDEVVLGACLSHASIEDRRFPDPSRGLLPAVARGIAHRSVRNRGTLGGSLAYADPAAEWPSVLLALDASVEIAGREGRRIVAVREFLKGPMSVDLEPCELVVGVRVAKLAERTRFGFRKRARKAGDFAEALAVVIVGATTRVVVGATPAGPHPMPRTARSLEGCSGWSARCESALREAFAMDLAEAPFELDEYEEAVQLHNLLGAAREALSA
jgi:carbon-monoxide dehydrogenase medium subunit